VFLVKLSPSRLGAAFLLVAGLVATTHAEDPPKSREQSIQEVEKQIADLQKRLAELKAKGSSTTKGAKKPLTLAEVETWRSIRGAALSPDGKWFAHRVGPTEGDGEVILRNNADGKETKFPGGGGFGLMSFSSDSKWFGFTHTPFVKTGPGPTPPSPPKTKVVLVNLATAEKTELEGVSSFRFNGEASTHVALRKSSQSAPTSPGSGGSPTPAPAVSGSDLVLRELSTGIDFVLGNVAEYDFDKKGEWLVTVLDAAGQIGNGIHLRDMKTGAEYPLETGKATYRGLAFNEETTAFTLTKATEDTGYEGKWVSIIGFTDLGPKPVKTVYDPKDDKDFSKDMAISSTRGAAWTEALDGFTFGIAERKKKSETAPAPKEVGKKDEVKTEPGKEKEKEKKGLPGAGSGGDAKPDLVVWHWKDERLQPMQEKEAAADKVVIHSAVYWTKEKKFVRLSDDGLKQVALAPKQKFAIGRDTKPYEYMSYLNGKLYADVYVLDPKTGTRKKAVEKLVGLFGPFGGPRISPSPTGTHFLYYRDGQYHVYDMAAGKDVNVTEKVSASFVDADDDHNFDKPARPSLGWSRDGKFVLLSDGWDVWKVASDGSGGTNLTGNGKQEGIHYQSLFQFEPDPKPGYDLSQPLYASMFGEWTKKGGLGRIDTAKGGVSVLLWGDYAFGTPLKARKAEAFAFTRQSAVDYPDYYLTDASFKDAKKVTEANPQQKDYLWTAGTKLIEYKGVGGKRLQGALYLPANYEPGKKYPTIVYIYEKLSDRMHAYQPPASWAIGSIYTSNGYAVLMPDIAYRLNDPGMSAAECILPALDAAVATGVVDGDKMALHGHSWGGYQTAFMVTQTNRFKCAIAGAALTDLVSMYSSVYWNAGMANQPIFESSQGRFTGGYWDLQEAYIRNSPVYFAKNVQTPLLLLHNDKDGAVDFTQGVEYYNTLRRLQKPVVMLQYKGENHGLLKQENRKDYALRMKEFFDHYLMGKPAPDWWTEGVPHLKMEEHLKGRKP
jgi:dipeptidyl aminopeptidase/acylaminoacyl peptidase